MSTYFARSVVLAILLVAGMYRISHTAVSEGSVPNQARESFQSGEYDEALGLYLDTDGADRAAAVVGASRAYVLTGQYGKAEEICRIPLVKSPDDGRIQCQLAEVLVLTGRSGEAMDLLARVVSGPDAAIRSFVQYGKLLELRGRRKEAASFFQRAIDRYTDGILSDAEDIAMAAVAAWALNRHHDANRMFREALRFDPENLEAQVLWGDLFFEKHNHAEARVSYEKVLAQNRRYLPALVGLANTSGGHQAEKALLHVLEANPRSVSALEAMAAVSIDDDRFEAARAYLGRILEINPESLSAKTLLAAVAYLNDDPRTYERIRAEIEAFSPGSARFYSRLAEVCGRKYRFLEAVELAQKAIAIDPAHLEAHALLGVNLLRLGDEETGRTHLEYSFKEDPFNYSTLNMLKVLDTLAGFETRYTDQFVVRMDRTDADILWPYLKPLLEESWNTLTAKYEFTPKTPILIEVFPKHDDFSARTSGLPDMGPLLGVCFGSVITLDSPRAFKPPGSLNWKEILWHEFTHVITLQMTRNRMPRWLSEGISVFEERHGRPEWGRKQGLALIRAVQENRMLALRGLNEGFTKAETHAGISLAYHQSALVVEYIADRYGFESLKQLIYAYAASMEMDKNFRSVFDVSPDEFESGFSGWIDDRITALNVYVPEETSGGASGSYGGSSGPRFAFGASDSPDAAKKLRERLAENPRDFPAHLQLGALLYEAGDYDGAITHLTIARDLLPEYTPVPNPRLILADLYEKRGDEAGMIRELEAFARYQQHAFDACVKLARAAIGQREYHRAAYYLDRAIAVNPYHQDIHRLLAEVALKQTAHETAIREFEVLLALEIADPVEAHTNLADAFLRAGKKDRAKQNALAALEIAPMYERAQTILLDSLEP